MENPCFECPKKGCGSYHSVCKAYNDWKAEEETKKKKIREWNKHEGRDYIKLGAFSRRTNGVFRSKKK